MTEDGKDGNMSALAPQPSLTTFKDKLQQIVRKLLGYGAGYLIGAGYIDQELGISLIALGMALFDWGWFWWWNRWQVITVSGLKAGSNSKPSLKAVAAKLEAIKDS